MHETISKATLGHLFDVIHDLFCVPDNFPTMCSLTLLPDAAFAHKNNQRIEAVASVFQRMADPAPPR